MRVELIGHTNIDPYDLANHAARLCYENELPELGVGKKLPLDTGLFKKGHQTPFEHFSMNYEIESFSVWDVTSGLHLCHPFYNTSQKSGRFCMEMFQDEAAFKKIDSYIKKLWPSVGDKALLEVMKYVNRARNIYEKNIDKAISSSKKFVDEERPFASKKIVGCIPKFAQDQLRVLIPLIFPTSLLYTIDIITLVSMYETAWSPGMRYLTDEMVRLFIQKFPNCQFLFKEERRRSDNWTMPFDSDGDIGILYKPKATLLRSDTNVTLADRDDTHHVDRLPFMPEMMDNSVNSMNFLIEVSMATKGQNERHRTTRRGRQKFTGNFYMPPILKELGLEKSAIDLMKDWKRIRKMVPETLGTSLAPYGAMVSYETSGPFNSVIHEGGKRTCWCAGEEIYHLSVACKREIEKRFGDSDLSAMYEPACFRTGVCAEGDGHCGRDMSLRKEKEKYFVERGV